MKPAFFFLAALLLVSPLPSHAADKPNKDMPEAVTRKVISAASRYASSASATAACKAWRTRAGASTTS